MDNNNLGVILRERRREKRLTLTQLGSLAGVNEMHIGRIERGESSPKEHTLRKLANPLGFGEVELLKLAGFKDKHVHYWLINSDNVGHCRDCPEVRDFGRLLQREGVFAVAGRRSAKARKEALGRRSKEPATIAKISATTEKLWQDPEYRDKQRAAHASLPGRHH